MPATQLVGRQFRFKFRSIRQQEPVHLILALIFRPLFSLDRLLQ